MNEVDVIDEQHAFELLGTNDDNIDTVQTYTVRSAEPIIIRGTGHITVFALNNKFDEEYPQALHYKVSRDEFQETIKRVNMILKKNVEINFRWLIFGCACCCCTFGLSLCPVLCLNQRSKNAINKVLDWENDRLYHKIGLHWQLKKQKYSNSAVQEYVLIIDIRPPLSLSLPD